MSSINIPGSSVTIDLSKLNKTKVYELFGELSIWLNLNSDEHNQHINADGVIEEVRNERGMSDTSTDIAISSFLGLDVDIQRNIATDALNNAMSLFSNVQPALDYIADINENEIDPAAENKIYDIYTAAASDVIHAFRQSLQLLHSLRNTL